MASPPHMPMVPRAPQSKWSPGPAHRLLAAACGKTSHIPPQTHPQAAQEALYALASPGATSAAPSPWKRLTGPPVASDGHPQAPVPPILRVVTIFER